MRLEINGADLSQRYTYVTVSGKVRVCARTLKAAIVVSDTDPSLSMPDIRPHAPVRWADDGGSTLFLGVAIAYNRTSTGVLLTVTAMDLGYYLSRNKGYYSFSCTPEAAVRQLAADWGIQTGSIAGTDVQVPRKFPGVELHNIINTMYTKASEKTGRKYHIRFEGEALSVVEKPITEDKVLAPKVNVISSSVTVDVSAYVNTVEVRSETGRLLRTVGGAEEASGLLQDIIIQAAGEDVAAQANAILEDGQEQQTVTVECLGDPRLVTGNAVLVRETSAGVTGLFWIDADTHTWKDGMHTCKLTLNFRSIMAEEESGEEL